MWQGIKREDYKLIVESRQLAFSAHDRWTNHDYKKGVGYSYHLQMAVDFGIMFLHLLEPEERAIAISGIYLHDAVEDVRLTKNDIIKSIENKRVAQLSCNMCCDIWGGTRDERNSPSYYKRVNSDKLSVYGKLCDRMANITESILTKGEPTDFYIDEMEDFLSKLDIDKNGFQEMSLYLKEIAGFH
ncbi:hypothetical protein BPT24_201 [Tenacibaculum phage pT24]|uniref:Phosphohydrolase n=1 Tax=Tenacibaculum phage pT24 TaxID=1880590 RepID=A0A1B4XWZ4_9CAUD|nr:metal-dependent phosphohydrolase [Tenacibaculum phage pT24]BAV39325.1 hypothetical protein BPT24_201 [Tenacibaculum phage pT24]